MFVSLHTRGSNALQEFAKCRIAAGIGSQHQGIHEDADQLVEFSLGSSGDDSADGDIVSTAEFAEQGRDRSLQ